MKSIKVPFIEGLDGMGTQELELVMEEKASKFAVCENNWPDYAPYAPDCNGAIARCEKYLAVMYHVRGLDLRATAMEDNGRSWEDSCCEFFVADPSDGTYYNFELTCIGSLLSAKKFNRSEGEARSAGVLARVIRHSSLPRQPYEEKGGIFSWMVAMLIPFDLIGMDSGNLPEKVRANFYKCGDLTAHPHFLSWNPIDTPKPDFHRPEFFGELVFA